MSQTTNGWLRVAAVARLLGVSTSQVRILINSGELAASRHSASPRGMYLVHELEVTRYKAKKAQFESVGTSSATLAAIAA